MSTPEQSTASKPKLRIVAPPPAIYLFPLVIALALDVKLLHVPALPWQLRLAGSPLVLVGFLLALWGALTLKRHNTALIPYKKTTTIVADGPFRFSRNPIYLAFTLAYLGVAFHFRSMLAVLLLPFVLWLMHWGVITREEKYLEEGFGDVYTSYKSRVRRWL